MTVCQIKRNTSSVKTSCAVFQFRHFLGRPLILASASASSSCVTFEKSVPFGKNSRRSPLAFSFRSMKRSEWRSAI